MSNRTLIAIIVIALVAIGGYFLISSTASAPTPENEEVAATTPDATPDATAPTATRTTAVSYTDEGFSPATITVKVGDTVSFTNNSTRRMWVASDEHPTHTEFDGTSTREHCGENGPTNASVFDQCTGSPAGTTYSFTFTKAGTYSFHNHARAADGGTVTVTN